MTGFGRTGRMFAIEHEAVIPDMLILGKALNGGYLPLVITLVSEKISSAFDGSGTSGKALAYGHSHTGNAPGSATARASLEVFRQEDVLETLQPEIRRCGFIVGKELDESNERGLPGFAAEVCIEARRYGLLTRPIRNVVVLMPPLCITIGQLTQAVEALRASIAELWHARKSGERDAEKVTA